MNDKSIFKFFGLHFTFKTDYYLIFIYFFFAIILTIFLNFFYNNVFVPLYFVLSENKLQLMN